MTLCCNILESSDTHCPCRDPCRLGLGHPRRLEGTCHRRLGLEQSILMKPLRPLAHSVDDDE